MHCLIMQMSEAIVEDMLIQDQSQNQQHQNKWFAKMQCDLIKTMLPVFKVRSMQMHG